MERYVIERATHFRAGFEKEDAWQATLDAKSIYQNIAKQSRDADQPAQQAGGATQGPMRAGTLTGVPAANTYPKRPNPGPVTVAGSASSPSMWSRVTHLNMRRSKTP